MALIKFGGGVVGMAGKIAGTVFARNRYGQYARSWSKPVNPKTDRQTGARARIGLLGAAWAVELTEEQRAGWNVYAANVPMKNRLGETMNLSGFNQYCRTNGVLLAIGEARKDDAPGIFTLGEQDPSLEVSVDATAGEIKVSFDADADWVSEDGAFLAVSVGRPVNKNVEFFGGPFRLAGHVSGSTTSAPTSPAAIESPWPLQAGQRVFVQCRIVRADGRVSEFFRCSGVSE